MTHDIIDTKIARREQTLRDLNDERRRLLREIGKIDDDAADRQLAEIDDSIRSVNSMLSALAEQREREVHEQRQRDHAAAAEATRRQRQKVADLSRKRIAIAQEVDDACATLLAAVTKYRAEGVQIEREASEVLKQLQPDLERRMGQCMLLLPMAGGRDPLTGSALIGLVRTIVRELNAEGFMRCMDMATQIDDATFEQAATSAADRLAGLATL